MYADLLRTVFDLASPPRAVCELQRLIGLLVFGACLMRVSAMRVSNSSLTARHRGMYNADAPDHVADLDGPTLRPPAHYELCTPVLQLRECL